MFRRVALAIIGLAVLTFGIIFALSLGQVDRARYFEYPADHTRVMALLHEGIEASDGLMPYYSSRDPVPSWAVSSKRVASELKTRSWGYLTPPGVSGKKFADLSDSTVLIVVDGANRHLNGPFILASDLREYMKAIQ